MAYQCLAVECEGSFSKCITVNFMDHICQIIYDNHLLLFCWALIQRRD